MYSNIFLYLDIFILKQIVVVGESTYFMILVVSCEPSFNCHFTFSFRGARHCAAGIRFPEAGNCYLDIFKFIRAERPLRRHLTNTMHPNFECMMADILWSCYLLSS
jgi:hypothetical protein